PLEGFEGERGLPLGGGRQRSVLALLLLRGNEALTRDVIVDELWGERPPPRAAKGLQNCMSALRKSLRAAGGDSAPSAFRTRSSWGMTSSTAIASSTPWRTAARRSPPARRRQRPRSYKRRSRCGAALPFARSEEHTSE